MCDTCAILAPVQAVPLRLLTADALVASVRDSYLTGIVAYFFLVFCLRYFPIYLTELR